MDRDNRLLRAVALVSYGSGFLRNELPMEDWYRHCVFFTARFDFRAPDQNTLLADDFTLWLHNLASSGAMRLSLHRIDEFDVRPPHLAHELGYAVVAHFPDHHQIWASGREMPTWPEVDEIPRGKAYAGDIDRYWLVAEPQGQLEIPATNWTETAAAIAADLELEVPSTNPRVPPGPFFPPLPRDIDWARLPLFPSPPHASLAHRIVATLDREQAQFANDTQPQNEGNLYLGLDDEGCRELDRWAQRLDRWMADVLLRAANECGARLFKQIRPPEELADRRQETADTAGSVETAQALKESSNAPVRTPLGKWSARLAYVLAFVALSLFVVAIAHLIASFPWLAILFSLPLMLYAINRRDP